MVRMSCNFSLTVPLPHYISPPLEAMQVEEVASLALATGDSYTQLVLYLVTCLSL